MEGIGYVVTNNFILIAVDTNLIATIGENHDKLKLQFNNIRKVYKISDTTAISIIGLPHKISDIYKYVLSIKNSDKSFDAVDGDLKFIFNSNLESILAQISKVASVIKNFTDENDVLDKDKFFEYFADDHELLKIAKESLALIESNTELGTRIFLFSYENGKNIFGNYISIANNLQGNKIDDIPKDNIYLVLASAKEKNETVLNLQNQSLEKLKPFMLENWENTRESEINLKNKAKEVLEEALIKLTPFDLTPNIVFYELSKETDYIFVEPNIKLIDINFDRN